MAAKTIYQPRDLADPRLTLGNVEIPVVVAIRCPYCQKILGGNIHLAQAYECTVIKCVVYDDGR